jgi:uncharacterized protein YbjQ (UPF0145 family)
MKITTANNIIGKEIGIVTGSFVASKVFYKDFFAGIRNFFGWEIKEYTRTLEEAREEAIRRMIKNAEKMNGSAIINVRLTTAQTTRGAAEILAYGTVVKE